MKGADKGFIGVGLWAFSADAGIKVALITKIYPEIYIIWFDNIFGNTKGDCDLGCLPDFGSALSKTSVAWIGCLYPIFTFPLTRPMHTMR